MGRTTLSMKTQLKQQYYVFYFFFFVFKGHWQTVLPGTMMLRYKHKQKMEAHDKHEIRSKV